MARQAGDMAQGDGEMCFAQSDATQENNVGFVADECQPEEILNLQPVDFGWPVPSELIQGFDDGEAGFFDQPLNGPLLALMGLPLHQVGQIVDVVPTLVGGLFGDRVEMVTTNLMTLSISSSSLAPYLINGPKYGSVLELL